MNLSAQINSLYDEESYGDSFSRTSSLFKIQSRQTSYGSFSGSDLRDFYSITPGVGQFVLYVTADPINGFTTSAQNYDFDVKITDASGNVILTSSGYDVTTRSISFQSNSNDTYYVEITNTFFKTFAYAATLHPAGVTGPTGLNLVGDNGDNVLLGAATDDTLSGLGGADTINGGAGDDIIEDSSGANYLRGDEGNDLIIGGSGFDDINGNMGNDTASGGAGDDWVVGGRDSDMLFGGVGDDIVYGNLGDDSLAGETGADLMRGGQGNDIVLGNDGNDWVSGDRGDDTMTGGAGADIFHTFGDAGIDRVTDFSLAEGDRVQLDPGTTWSVAQVGADTVISMAGGGQMVLVGVTATTLTGSWIFGA